MLLLSFYGKIVQILRVDRLLSHPHELESAVDDQEDACSCSCNDFATDDLRSLDFQDDGDGNGDGDRDQAAIGLIGDGERRRSGTTLEYSYKEEEEESSNDVGVIHNTDEMEDKLFWDTCMAGGYP
ncbi:unnamed protein product [Citrullus colocynthis]|uniref:Uncharacterized protein n=1 Tax=Citrullus colocynthis TaxID=252529 RepID=A0ABP0Z8G5_9ROSI